MAGMIIVEDTTDSATPSYLQAVSCPNNCNHEVRLLFQPILQYSQRGPRGFADIQEDIEDLAMFRLEYCYNNCYCIKINKTSDIS